MNLLTRLYLPHNKYLVTFIGKRIFKTSLLTRSGAPARKILFFGQGAGKRQILGSVSFFSTFMSGTWACSLCSVKNDATMVVCSFCQATPDEKVETLPPKEKKRKHADIAPPSRESSNPLFVWECKICTLVNPFRLSACDGCGVLRFPGNVEANDDLQIVAHVNPNPPEAKRPKLSEVGTISFYTIKSFLWRLSSRRPYSSTSNQSNSNSNFLRISAYLGP